MKFKKEDIDKIVHEIVTEKLVKKNKKYGDSIYDPQTIFNDIDDPEVLINVRLDDKMGRLKQLDKSSDKYDSELLEIVGYLLLLINYRRNKTFTYEEVFGHPEPEIPGLTDEVIEKAKASDMSF
jgi:hypothetical protein